MMGGQRTRVVLFDLGGVLFEFAGVQAFGDMIGEKDGKEVLRRWVSCPWVQRYDRGRCSSEEFAAGMVLHHDLDITAADFLEVFQAWVPGPYPGAHALVLETKASGASIACLSNTNHAHWNAANGLAAFAEDFDHRFLSFEMGLVKPEQSAFAHVVGKLGCEPNEILFLDDVELNVEAAERFGLDAVLADGVEAARATLTSRGILPAAGLSDERRLFDR